MYPRGALVWRTKGRFRGWQFEPRVRTVSPQYPSFRVGVFLLLPKLPHRLAKFCTEIPPLGSQPVLGTSWPGFFQQAQIRQMVRGLLDAESVILESIVEEIKINLLVSEKPVQVEYSAFQLAELNLGRFRIPPAVQQPRGMRPRESQKGGDEEEDDNSGQGNLDGGGVCDPTNHVVEHIEVAEDQATYNRGSGADCECNPVSLLDGSPPRPEPPKMRQNKWTCYFSRWKKDTTASIIWPVSTLINQKLKLNASTKRLSADFSASSFSSDAPPDGSGGSINCGPVGSVFATKSRTHTSSPG